MKMQATGHCLAEARHESAVRRPTRRHRSSSSSTKQHFKSARLVDFKYDLETAEEGLNRHMRDFLCGPSKVFRRQGPSTARAAYLPFYAFDVELDLYFRGQLPGKKVTGEFVFRGLRFEADHTNQNKVVDMMVYASYDYRRDYAQAIKFADLQSSSVLAAKIASPNMGAVASSYPAASTWRHVTPDLDPYSMSQSMAYDMVKERMLKHCKELATAHFASHGPEDITDVLVAMKVRKKRCVPIYLPAYVFEYRYLGLPFRALVSGETLEVGGEAHRSPWKLGGTAFVATWALFERPTALLFPVTAAAMLFETLRPPVMKFYRGLKRRLEANRDQSTKRDWYDWEKSGEWSQWFQAKWDARERQHRQREFDHESRHDRERRHTTRTSRPEAGGKSLYAVLGLQGQERTATTEDVKRAFRRLALKYHPDAMISKPEFEQQQANDRFREILTAYKVLRNKNKRKQYDQTGAYA